MTNSHYLFIKGLDRLYLKKFYIINQLMMYMVSFYDRNGKLITLVTQANGSFVVDKSPVEIIEDSIKCIGFDFKGALSTAKWILGDIHMCPVMINPIHKICVFPTKSAKHEDSIWLNPNHIVRTSSLYRSTYLEFTNGHTLEVPCRLAAFNTKLKNAEQLNRITVEIGSNPTAFYFEPKKKELSLIITKRKEPKKKLPL
jgi:competence protein ComK